MDQLAEDYEDEEIVTEEVLEFHSNVRENIVSRPLERPKWDALCLSGNLGQ